MPRRLPPIAPPGPVNAPLQVNTQPVRIEHLNNLDALPDEEGYGAQLALLQADKRRFLDAAHPIKDALNLALQQPAGVLLQRYAATLAAFQQANAAGPDSDDPTERPLSADIDQRPAIVAFTETQVAKAILGDMTAMALVSDRVEGKAGQRRGDVDAESEAQRARMRGVINQLVTDMVERRAGRAVDVEVIEET